MLKLVLSVKMKQELLKLTPYYVHSTSSFTARTVIFQSIVKSIVKQKKNKQTNKNKTKTKTKTAQHLLTNPLWLAKHFRQVSFSYSKPTKEFLFEFIFHSDGLNEFVVCLSTA